MRKTTWAGAVALGLVAIIVASKARADDWIVTMGARLQTSPPYEGAGYNRVLPVPTFSLRRQGQPERLSAPDDGYGIAVLNTGWFSAGPTVQFRGARDDSGERAGLHKVDFAVEPGGFVNFWPTNWLRLHAEERRGVVGHHGWIGDAGLDLVVKTGPWMGSVGPRVGWGDKSYMDQYFGVTPSDAAASPLIHTAYEPGAGPRYAGATATLAYRFSPRWQTTANFGYHHLVDQAADSPIVHAFHAQNEFSGGVGVKYNFGWTPR
jgi:outer membrane scaffolding protein for murein synthesis (MipA/OmpV family)